MSLTITRVAQAIASLAACAMAVAAHAKPIAFAHGTTVMGEYGAGTMTEVQAFYAPTFRYSLGASHLTLDSAIDRATRDMTYFACELPAEALEPGERSGKRLRMGRRRPRAHR